MELSFKSSVYPLQLLGWTVPCYAALSALAVNLVVSWLVTMALRATGNASLRDETIAADYV